MLHYKLEAVSCNIVRRKNSCIFCLDVIDGIAAFFPNQVNFSIGILYFKLSLERNSVDLPMIFRV